MVGGIDRPEIILESASGFSESDILELLTWGKRFEDQEVDLNWIWESNRFVSWSAIRDSVRKKYKRIQHRNDKLF